MSSSIDCWHGTRNLFLGLFLALGLSYEVQAQGSSDISEARIEAYRQWVEKTHLAQCDLSLFLAGDTNLTVPWSNDDDPDFLRLIGEIRAADAAIVNLETVIHEFRGYAQADSGGRYAASPPEIAGELRWAGIDLVSHANNHTFDYGSIGVLETHENVQEANILLAGSGPDLDDARAPRYLSHPNGTVALVAMSSTFPHYGKASLSRFDMRGRPGLNPLTLTEDTVITITPMVAEALEEVAKFLGYAGERFTYREFDIGGLQFQVRNGFDLTTGLRPVAKDRIANLAAISEAAGKSDVLVVSLHYHGGEDYRDWLKRFAREAIELGTDVFFVHGLIKFLGLRFTGNGRYSMAWATSFFNSNSQIGNLLNTMNN